MLMKLKLCCDFLVIVINRNIVSKFNMLKGDQVVFSNCGVKLDLDCPTKPPDESRPRPFQFGSWEGEFRVMRMDICQDQDPHLLMSGPNNIVRRTSVALQKVQQKHIIELQNKRAGVRRCRQKELMMIKHDARIGRGFDFKAGGMFEDLSFEREKTLLQLWNIYRNGYTTDQVLDTMYIPLIVIESGGRVICRAEKCAFDNTMISELRARYQDIKEEEMIQREQEEIAKYQELHNVHRGGCKNLLDAVSGTSSRPNSILSTIKESPFNRSTDTDHHPSHKESDDDDHGFINVDKFRISLPILCYCCYSDEQYED